MYLFAVHLEEHCSSLGDADALNDAGGSLPFHELHERRHRHLRAELVSTSRVVTRVKNPLQQLMRSPQHAPPNLLVTNLHPTGTSLATSKHEPLRRFRPRVQQLHAHVHTSVREGARAASLLAKTNTTIASTRAARFFGIRVSSSSGDGRPPLDFPAAAFLPSAELKSDWFEVPLGL